MDLEKIISLPSFSLGMLLKIGVVASFSSTLALSYELHTIIKRAMK